MIKTHTRNLIVLIATITVGFCFFLVDIPEARAATTTKVTIYPVAGNDGSIRQRSVDWDSVLHAGTGSQVRKGISKYNIGTAYASQSAGSNIYQIIRGFMSFDTSLIPDEAIVSSSTLYIIPNGRAILDADEYAYIRLVGPVNLANPPTLTLEDFDQVGSIDNPVFLSHKKVTKDDPWIVGEAIPFSLNYNGLQIIKKDGFSSFSFREGHDIENVAPSPIDASANDWYIGGTDAFFTQWTRPYLVIEYSLPPDNSAPDLQAVGDKTVSENENLLFTVSASDPDSDELDLTASSLPNGATFSEATGEFSWTPGYSDAGIYEVTFTAAEVGSEGLSDSETITITVENINQAPELATVGSKAITEGEALTFSVSAVDPDDDSVTYSSENLPNGASFNSETGAFSWTPGYSDAGTYEITITATEDTSEALSDSETVTITVINYNRAPELAVIGNQTVAEGQNLSFTVTATDPDNDSITYSAVNLPSGATFNTSTGEFSWATGFSDAGNYLNIEFTATDNGSPMELDVELIIITVGDVNRAPEIANPGPQDITEGQIVSFEISATDPDNDSLTLSVSNLPSGATFNAATGEFYWNTNLSDAGIYTVTFTATDDGTPVESASSDVVISVGDDPTPVEQTQDIIETIVVYDLSQNVENSYLANLQKVEAFIIEGKITAALNQLNALLQKLQQDYQQNKITQTQYETLSDAVSALLADLS